MLRRVTPTGPRPGTTASDASYDRGSEGAPAPRRGRRSRLGLGSFALACCGLKLLILAGAALSVGSVGAIVRNVAIGAAGVAFATALTSFGMRRLRCGDGTGGHAGRDYGDLPEGRETG